MTRPLIVGPAPGKEGNGEPLSGRAGRRLSALCGLPLDAYLARFERVNLLDFYPGKLGKGDRFDPLKARFAALELTPRLRHRCTILLGLNVAHAFHLERCNFFEWFGAEIGAGALVAVAPHPSGVSLWWNDPGNVERARIFWHWVASRPLSDADSMASVRP